VVHLSKDAGAAVGKKKSKKGAAADE